MGGISVLVLLGFLSGLYMLFIAVFFVAVLYLIITYVFEALAVLGMRESRGDRAPALAWIPIYNKYLLGEIAGKKVLGVFTGIFTLVMIGTGAYCYRTLTMDRLIFGAFLVSAILGFILDLVIAYRLYKNVVPKWKDVLLLLSILSGGLLRPVILFGLRKKVTETDKKILHRRHKEGE